MFSQKGTVFQSFHQLAGVESRMAEGKIRPGTAALNEKACSGFYVDYKLWLKKNEALFGNGGSLWE